jgi:hypothetical protein
MNPPHDRGRWKDAIRVPAGQFPLLSVLDDMERGKEVTAARLEALQGTIPEVEQYGLRHLVVHKDQLSPERINTLVQLFSDIGARRTLSQDGVLVYGLEPR